MGQVRGIVVRGVLGGDEPDVGGHRGQGGERGLRVRPAGDVEGVRAAEVLAQPQPFAEEERGEQAALGGLGDAAERFEVGLGAGFGRLPDGSGVDALEEDAELELAGGRESGRGDFSVRPWVLWLMVGSFSFRAGGAGCGGVAAGGPCQPQLIAGTWRPGWRGPGPRGGAVRAAPAGTVPRGPCPARPGAGGRRRPRPARSVSSSVSSGRRADEPRPRALPRGVAVQSGQPLGGGLAAGVQDDVELGDQRRPVAAGGESLRASPRARRPGAPGVGAETRSASAAPAATASGAEEPGRGQHGQLALQAAAE